MLGAQVRQHTHRACACILDQCTGDDLQRLGHSLVRPLLHTLDALGLLAQLHRHGHLSSTTTRRQTRVEHDITRNAHGILQVPLDLVENVLRGTAEENGACFGVLALRQEGEILVADFFDLKQTAFRTNVGFLQVFNSVHNGCARGSRNSVVVCLSYTTQGCDVGFHQVVLCKICKVLVGQT